MNIMDSVRDGEEAVAEMRANVKDAERHFREAKTEIKQNIREAEQTGEIKKALKKNLKIVNDEIDHAYQTVGQNVDVVNHEL